jgi:hypothetical protein
VRQFVADTAAWLARKEAVQGSADLSDRWVHPWLTLPQAVPSASFGRAAEFGLRPFPVEVPVLPE